MCRDAKLLLLVNFDNKAAVNGANNHTGCVLYIFFSHQKTTVILYSNVSYICFNTIIQYSLFIAYDVTVLFTRRYLRT